MCTSIKMCLCASSMCVYSDGKVSELSEAKPATALDVFIVFAFGNPLLRTKC